MNDYLPPDITAQLLLSFPALRLYALCTILLVLKMHAVGIATGVARTRAKVTMNPEDAARYNAQASDVDPPEVARALRAHRNDLENIPPFLLLALVGVLVGAAPLGLKITLIAFTAARVGHSIAYLRSMQPWRSITFGVGQLCVLALVVMILLRIVP